MSKTNGVSAQLIAHALADAAPRPYWLDQADRPGTLPSLAGAITADLLVVGGGYTGLWAALLAKVADPGRSVVVVDAGTCGWAASGRNGGFCAASLTHGLENGITRFRAEIDTLERMGRDNLSAIETAVYSFDLDCHFERTGALEVAVAPYQVDELRDGVALAKEYGSDITFLDGSSVRAEVDSPTYLAGAWNRDGMALVDPARLAWGLRRACQSLGVSIYEHSRVVALERVGVLMRAVTPDGMVSADRIVLATNAFPPLLRRLKHFLVPVYDYALMTEPLTAAQLTSIGWHNRQGLGDTANQFHYYRLSHDNRILFGGYDAVYHYGNRVHPSLEQRPATFNLLAEHFYQTFPQLESVRFSHKWAGVIDTCTRFCAFWGTAFSGSLSYVAGYTGLGVAATRFGAKVALDLVDGVASAETSLEMVRTKPIPFPPEPLRYVGVQLTRWSLARADANEGRRNLWLRAMDAAGLGYDS